ncbi:ethanolamine ammonia-lyase subunit EutC [Paucibacter sp. R3-3]|uniref:Ethanolamine ammonia-lyase small subunit n=1 Tax=Roseateles agri TaxID=3098619 RepID=A0ABU5DH23_9BURK|nr:ethanolamine ammonia-lyase subunit EutC [Paucibacter sp. R3-3]MDY0745449.1 ethanolamine ammonia-lyase subunit EutC [Paucibacter sp. R3-3]
MIWERLRGLTPARIGLGRSGEAGLPTAEWLRFAAAHAQARDAVHTPLDVDLLTRELSAAGWPAPLIVRSRATSRAEYLRRPDLGRRLDPTCTLPAGEVDLALILADGLSAAAVQAHAVEVAQALRATLPSLTLAPPIIATQARVALGDEIGEQLGARLVLVLIGERPGLSSPDSLGAYLTWAPRPGRSDAERNCVSNIRPAGLPADDAARRLAWLVEQSLRRGLSGVALKDDSASALLS